MRTSLRKIGNSRGIIIPAALLAAAEIGDEVELRQEAGHLVIEAVKAPRAGWAEAAASIAAQGDDEEIWPVQFEDEDDGEWEW
jgi:antitoxin MazE